MRSFLALFFLMAFGNLSATRFLPLIYLQGTPYIIAPVLKKQRPNLHEDVVVEPEFQNSRSDLAVGWFCDDDDSGKIELKSATQPLADAIFSFQASEVDRMAAQEIPPGYNLACCALIPAEQILTIRLGLFDNVSIFLMTDTQALVEHFIHQVSRIWFATSSDTPSSLDAPGSTILLRDLAPLLPYNHYIPTPEESGCIVISAFLVFSPTLSELISQFRRSTALLQRQQLANQISWTKTPPVAVDPEPWPDDEEKAQPLLQGHDQFRTHDSQQLTHFSSGGRFSYRRGRGGRFNRGRGRHVNPPRLKPHSGGRGGRIIPD